MRIGHACSVPHDRSASYDSTHFMRAQLQLSRTVLFPLCLLGACAQVSTTQHPIARPVAAPAPVVRNSDALVALVDGQSITFATVETPLIEAGGTQALRDAVLDERLSDECARRHVEVTAALCDAERTLLLETLSNDPREADELLRSLRATRGLGATRFAALLARNAALRLLVQQDIVMDDEGLRATFDTLHGPKRIARVAVVADLPTAERFLVLVNGGRAFGDVAAELSIDASGPRGGILPPMAALDPSWPSSVRRAVFALQSPGELTLPILDHARYAIFLFVSETPASGVTFETARADTERVLRHSRERLAMDGLARTLSSLDGVTIFDRRFDAPTP